VKRNLRLKKAWCVMLQVTEDLRWEMYGIMR